MRISDWSSDVCSSDQDWLRQRNDVRVLGPTDPAERAPTVAIHTKNKPAAEVLAGLTARGIAAGAGHFYGYRVAQAPGLDPEAGVPRVSFVHYTAPEEIGRASCRVRGWTYV